MNVNDHPSVLTLLQQRRERPEKFKILELEP